MLFPWYVLGYCDSKEFGICNNLDIFGFKFKLAEVWGKACIWCFENKFLIYSVQVCSKLTKSGYFLNPRYLSRWGFPHLYYLIEELCCRRKKLDSCVGDNLANHLYISKRAEDLRCYLVASHEPHCEYRTNNPQSGLAGFFRSSRIWTNHCLFPWHHIYSV